MTDANELVWSDERSLAVWEPLVLEALRVEYEANEHTAEKVVANIERLFRYLGACDVSRWDEVTSERVVKWCWAARQHSTRKGAHRRTTQSTARNRQWMARAALHVAQTLGAQIDPAKLSGVRIDRTSDYLLARPLTADEAELVRVHADAGLMASRRSLMVAFSFAGGSASEITSVRMCDVDAEAGTVAFSGKAARIAPLDTWGVETVRRYLCNKPPVPADEMLCVTSRSSKPTHSVSVRLGQVVHDAGLKGVPGVTARSIRLTTASEILDAHGIEAAARFLGSPSLDNTADVLGYWWRFTDG